MNALIQRRGLLAAGPPAPELEEGGGMVGSSHDYAPALGREPALPLYPVCYSDKALRRTIGYEPGRVLICTKGSEGRILSDGLWSQLCTGDVPMVWLYREYEGPGEVPRFEGWEEAEAAIRDFGPQVRAVMVANQKAETGYEKDLWAGGGEESRHQSVKRCTEFVKRAGSRLRDLGARPCFGLLTWQILLSAYWVPDQLGDDPLLAALNDLDALVICFCAYGFWPGPLGTYMRFLYRDDPQGLILPHNYLDAPPYAKLKGWVQQIECWGGVGYLAGLSQGTDAYLAEGGFAAGVIGELPQ